MGVANVPGGAVGADHGAVVKLGVDGGEGVLLGIEVGFRIVGVLYGAGLELLEDVEDLLFAAFGHHAGERGVFLRVSTEGLEAFKRLLGGFESFGVRLGEVLEDGVHRFPQRVHVQPEEADP